MNGIAPTHKSVGGGQKILSLDLATEEGRLNLQLAHDLTPERLYDRKWTLMLLELVMGQLKVEFVAAGKEQQFELLKAVLTGERQGFSYASAATELGISEDSARQAAHRLRKRYRELLRREVAQTLANPDEVDEEINSHLITLDR